MLIELAVIAIIIVADLLSKDALFNYLSSCKGMEADGIKGFIDLIYVENTGAGFGIFSDNVAALSAVTIIVTIILFACLVVFQKENEFLRISITFIIGGGIGNLVDRMSIGYVRDFFQFSFWLDFPVFNVADIFVTVGGFMLIIALIYMLIDEAKKSKAKLKEEQENSQETEEQTNILEGKDILDVAQPLNEFLDNNIENEDKKDE